MPGERPEQEWQPTCSVNSVVCIPCCRAMPWRPVRRPPRLPIDDEIIDRALAIATLADRNVRPLAYDPGQSNRAHRAGLPVVKLGKEIGEEPA
jgi:hypothetical protein